MTPIPDTLYTLLNPSTFLIKLPPAVQYCGRYCCCVDTRSKTDPNSVHCHYGDMTYNSSPLFGPNHHNTAAESQDALLWTQLCIFLCSKALAYVNILNLD